MWFGEPPYRVPWDDDHRSCRLDWRDVVCAWAIVAVVVLLVAAL